jgi:hypothetical protein
LSPHKIVEPSTRKTSRLDNSEIPSNREAQIAETTGREKKHMTRIEDEIEPELKTELLKMGKKRIKYIKQNNLFVKQCSCGKHMATVHLCDECFRDAVTN